MEQGAIAGGLVARILNGESAEEIPEVFDRTTRKVFDAQVMERYGIKESRLPKGSQVVNRRPTIWGQYGKYLAVGLAAFFAQSAIIVSLLVNRYRRIRAENEARALAGQILTAVEDERSYLARELHDDLPVGPLYLATEDGKPSGKASHVHVGCTSDRALSALERGAE